MGKEQEMLFRGRTAEGKVIFSKGFFRFKDGTVILIEKEEDEIIHTCPIIPDSLKIIE